MNDLVSRRKMPIIVGGTNYYIESLLWQILVEDPKASGNTTPASNSTAATEKGEECENVTDDNNDDKIATQSSENTLEEIHDEENSTVSFTTSKKMKYDDSIETNESLHKRLAEIDPEMARRLHPNNRRKVIR
uniref:tRNA dimethylallyltransferase n=1 Tax=Bracon brevicornis TaxID=1563983 RepID=A0A6V7LYA1_9HYME